jgi:hypothetical protein
VLDDVAPLSATEIEARQPNTDPAAAQARTERRLAMHLFRAGERTAAERHLAAALTLAPNDWTINRGSMPIRGQDPFGQAFMDFYQSWEAAGRPGYGA